MPYEESGKSPPLLDPLPPPSLGPPPLLELLLMGNPPLLVLLPPQPPAKTIAPAPITSTDTEILMESLSQSRGGAFAAAQRLRYWIPPSGPGGCGVKPMGTTHDDRSKRMNSIAFSSFDRVLVASHPPGTPLPPPW